MIIKADQPKAPANRPVVLAVDDDEVSLESLAMILKGYEVLTTTKGADAVEFVRSRRVDCVLLDLLMPKLPGIEVLRALKADPATAAIPVVILSNSSREEDKGEAVRLGAVGYYVKANLSLKELAAQVTQLIKDHASRR